MRKVIIEIKDDVKDTSVRGETTIEAINHLFEHHKLISIIDILHQLNNELNKELNEDVKLSFSSQLNTGQYETGSNL